MQTFKRLYKISAKQWARLRFLTGLPLLATFSCATLPEQNIYTDATPNGAVITHIYSTDVSFIGQAAWDNIREGMSCVSGTGIAAIKAFVEEVCSEVSCYEGAATAAQRIIEARQARLRTQ